MKPSYLPTQVIKSVCQGKYINHPYRRTFHSTIRNEDFMSWFKTKKAEQNRAKKVKSTKEFIADIESGKQGIDESGFQSDGSKTHSKQQLLKLELIPENFVGIRRVEKVLLEDIPWNSWKSVDKVTNQEGLDKVIIESCKDILNPGAKETDQFPDLITKFKFVKKLQSLSGYSVPDHELSKLTSPLQFKSYYNKNIISGKLLQFNEKEPNAIYLTKDDFKQPNIHLVETVTSKIQKQKFNQILKEVQSLKERETNKEIERLRSKN